MLKFSRFLGGVKIGIRHDNVDALSKEPCAEEYKHYRNVDEKIITELLRLIVPLDDDRQQRNSPVNNGQILKYDS